MEISKISGEDTERGGLANKNVEYEQNHNRYVDKEYTPYKIRL